MNGLSGPLWGLTLCLSMSIKKKSGVPKTCSKPIVFTIFLHNLGSPATRSPSDPAAFGLSRCVRCSIRDFKLPSKCFCPYGLSFRGRRRPGACQMAFLGPLGPSEPFGTFWGFLGHCKAFLALSGACSRFLVRSGASWGVTRWTMYRNKKTPGPDGACTKCFKKKHSHA